MRVEVCLCVRFATSVLMRAFVCFVCNVSCDGVRFAFMSIVSVWCARDVL